MDSLQINQTRLASLDTKSQPYQKPPSSLQNPLSQPFLALKASAGSGKTFNLALRYVWLLFNGAKPSEILALTFTNKATKEMQERVLNVLKELALPHTKSTSTFISTLENMGLSPQKIHADAERIYKEFLDSNPKICTIDSFFNEVLHKFCWYVGLSQDYKIGEEIEIESLFEEFLLTLLRHSTKSNTTNIFNSLTQFCVDFDIDFGQVMEHLEQWHNDKIHFNNKFLSTIHSYSKSEVKSSLIKVQESILATLSAMQEVLKKGEVSQQGLNALQASSMAEFIKKEWTFLRKEDPREYKFFSKALKNEALNTEFCTLFEQLKENLKRYFLLKERTIFIELARILDAFDKAKNTALYSSKKLSFANCALKVYELLVLGKHLNGGLSGIDTQFFYFRMDNAISHILVDEFQDTSPMQYEILRPLIEEIYSGQGRDIRNINPKNNNNKIPNNEQQSDNFHNRSVFFVGDSKQCIYGFRGSEAGFFDEIIKHSPLHKHNLPHNYRSKKIIIDFVNACFMQIFGEQQYQIQTMPDSANGSDINDITNGFVCIENKPTLTPSSNNKDSQNTQDSNAQSISNQRNNNPIILKVLESLEILFLLGIKPNDIAILCFRNDDILSINEAIKQRFNSIKTTPEIKSAFIQKPSVRFMLSALKFILLDIQNHKNSNAKSQNASKNPLKKAMDFHIYECLKIAGKKAFALPKESQMRLLESYKTSLRDCLQQSRQNLFIDSASQDKQDVFYKPSKCILQITKAFKIYDKNIQKLLEISLEKNDENIQDFIQRLENQVITPPKEHQTGLRILTIHAAKGLEFPYVILCDRLGGESHKKPHFIYDKSVHFVEKKREIIDKDFALVLESTKQKEKIEKNNVLYVACTRAKNGLIIIPTDEIYTSKDKDGHSKSAFKPILDSICTPFFNEHFNALNTLQHLQHKASLLKQNTLGQVSQSPILTATQNEIEAHITESKTPIILTQQSFGTQSQLLKKEATSTLSFSLQNATNMRFGEALHLALEYALGFSLDETTLQSLLQNHFGKHIDISHILALVKKAKNNSQFIEFLENAKVFVEVPLFYENELKRIDLLIKKERQIFVFDYKSGINSKEEHKKQVNGYVNALQNLYSNHKITGYVAYIRNDISWEQC